MKRKLTKKGKRTVTIVLCLFTILVLFGGCKIKNSIKERQTIKSLKVPNNDF